MSAFDMSTFFYMQHYREKISPKLTQEQKETLAHKISELTLERPIWLDHEKDWRSEFPELEGLVSNGISISGLYLCTIMDGIVKDLQSNHETYAEKTIGPPFPKGTKESWEK